jgi:uncharacterized protein
MLRLLKWLLALAALAWLGTCAFLYFDQRSLLYYPVGTRLPADKTDFSINDQGLTLRGWVLNPGQPDAVLFFGGNGDAVEKLRDVLAQWAPQRTVYLLAYRGYGASDGSPTEQGLFADALALYDTVSPRHRRIAAIGRSLGTGVATYLAAQRPLQQLALITPYDSIARVARHDYPIFPVNLLLHDKYESWRYAPQVHCPVLMVEAQDDKTIPADSTTRLQAAFDPPPQFLRVDGAGHNSILRRPETAVALTAFLKTSP